MGLRDPQRAVWIWDLDEPSETVSDGWVDPVTLDGAAEDPSLTDATELGLVRAPDVSRVCVFCRSTHWIPAAFSQASPRRIPPYTMNVTHAIDTMSPSPDAMSARKPLSSFT